MLNELKPLKSKDFLKNPSTFKMKPFFFTITIFLFSFLF
jgi:hypothetical protein